MSKITLITKRKIPPDGTKNTKYEEMNITRPRDNITTDRSAERRSQPIL